MSVVVAIPNPDDPEGELVRLEEFDSEDEAIEWAGSVLGADEEGKLRVVFPLSPLDYDSDDDDDDDGGIF